MVARSGVWSRHGRFYLGTVVAGDPGESGRDLCVIAHRFGYALIYGAAALNTVPVLGREPAGGSLGARGRSKGVT